MIAPTALETLLACPSCRFDPNSPVTTAANLAIVVMLLALTGIGGGFLALVVRFARGERNSSEDDTPP